MNTLLLLRAESREVSNVCGPMIGHTDPSSPALRCGISRVLLQLPAPPGAPDLASTCGHQQGLLLGFGCWPREPVLLILHEPLQILTGGCHYSSLTVGVLHPQNRREVLGGVGELTLSSRRTLVKEPQSSAWENLCFYLEPSHL